jgi:hypothetical protein
MALPQTGFLTANNTGLVISGKPSGRSSLPSTFAVFGTFGGGTIHMQAGFVDAAGITRWQDIPNTTFTAPDQAVNIAMKANYFRLVLAGATAPNLGWWFG